MPKCIILSGAPLSAKSTWAEKQGMNILSCDKIRLEWSPGKYKFDPKIEKLVWDDFYRRVRIYSTDKLNFIIDNTNCKQSYINKIKENIIGDYEVEIVKFEVSLLKSYYRNIKRWIFTGKWIPFRVIKDMKKNYNKLWKE